MSAVIIRQGAQIFAGAFKEITDASASAPTLRTLERSLDPLILNSPNTILGVDSMRARRAGSKLFVDLSARVRPELSASALAVLEQSIAKAIREARKDVKEVAVKFVPVEQLPSAPSSPSPSTSAPASAEDERPLSPVSLDEEAPRNAPAPPSRPTSPRTSRDEL